MIFFHGAPIPGDATQQAKFFSGRDCLLSYALRGKVDENLIFSVCRSFILDNGAYSIWKQGLEPDWDGFYRWIEKYLKHPRFEFFFIPDSIEGGEEENNDLILQSKFTEYGVPVFHLGEHPGRIQTFINYGFKRIGISPSAVGTNGDAFWNEMNKCWEIICDEEGRPKVKVHALMMLSENIVSSYPWSSGDSSTAAFNSIHDKKFSHSWSPTRKSARAALIAESMEKAQSPNYFQKQPIQMELI